MACSTSSLNIPGRFLSSAFVSAAGIVGQRCLTACVEKQFGCSVQALLKTDSSPETVNQLLALLVEESTVQHLAFEVGLGLTARSFASYGRALYSSPSWSVWCRTAAKFTDYIGLHSGAVSSSRDANKPAFRFDGFQQGLAHLEGFYAGALLKLYLLSCESANNASIYLPETLASYAEEKHKITCSPTQSGCFILLPGKSASVPRFANPKVHSVFVRDMSDGDSDEAQHPLAYHVQKLIESQSDLHHVNQTWVAEQMHMSERNLLRKLKSADISFRNLFNRVRSKRSLDLLFTGMSIGEIGEALGYSERATFERAFKSWQGITPVAMQSRFASLSAEHNIDNVITAESIPAPPTMLPKLVSLIGDDDFHIDELVELVESDPVITSKVMAIANSALYGYSNIASVKQAILTVLGVQKLQALVITILSTDVFSDLPSHFPYGKFWFRSLAAAQISTELAELNGVQSNQKFTIYIAALLHNIGHLGLAFCLSEGFDELMLEDMGSLSWREQLNLQRLRLGIHSIQVTEILLNLWAFPADIIKVLRESGVCSDFLTAEVSLSPSTLNQSLRLVDIAEAHWNDDASLRQNVVSFVSAEFDAGQVKSQKIEQVSDKLVSVCSTLWKHADTLV